jgi:hypothetical protein
MLIQQQLGFLGLNYQQIDNLPKRRLVFFFFLGGCVGGRLQYQYQEDDAS